MAFDSFAAPSNAFAPKPFDSFGISDIAAIPFNLVKELGLDVYGGARVAGATAGELASLLGIAAPITYDDLTTRDVKGAMMLAALGAGGVAGGAVRGALGVADTMLGRAGATALAEAASGAAFGLVSPLEEDESRLGSIVGQAALGGAVGAGASFIKSAAKATIAARQAGIKAAAKRVAFGQAIQHAEGEMIAREVAGVSLRNPETGERMGIRRSINKAGQEIIETTIFNTPAKGVNTPAAVLAKFAPNAITVSSPAKDFGAATAEAIRNGFTEELRPWDPTRSLRGWEGKMDAATMNAVAGANGDITAAIGTAELNKYQAIRQAAALNEESMRLYTSLVGEVVAPGNFLGTPELSPALMTDLRKELKWSAQDMLKAGPTGILRGAITEGIVDINNLAEGMSLADFADELIINDQIGAAAIHVSKRRDAFLTSVLLPTRIAKFFPEVAPLQQAADAALQQIEVAMRPSQQWLHDLMQRVSPDAALAGRDIIDNNLRVRLDDTSGLPSLHFGETSAAIYAAADALGNPEVSDFVRTVVPSLEDIAIRTQGLVTARAKGDLPPLGYFGLFNANRWKLNIKNFGDGPKVDWGSFWDSREEAMAEMKRVAAINPKIAGSIAPHSLTWSRDSLIPLDDLANQESTAHAALMSAHTHSFGPTAGNEALPLKTVLFRDYGDDPFQALSMYMYNAERAIHLSSFETVADQVLASLPDSQSNLRAWARQYTDDILGRPRQSEIWMDHLLARMGLDVAPRALRRYTGAIRRWETVSRLGGFFSGAVNLTQTAVNTYPVLGAKYTARGIGGLANYSKAVRELVTNGVDLGIYMPFTAENAGRSGTAFDSISAAFKERRFLQAAERISLYTFNGVEKVNRLVVAWGAYQRALDEGMERKAAGRVAQEVMERTQFNYRISNMPELLRGPIGGMLLQFKSFIANEIDFIASMSPKEAMRFGQAVVMTGGLAAFFNMPGTDVLNMASLGWGHEKLTDKLALAPSRSSNDIEAAAWRTVAFGLPGLLHVNMADHLGIGNTADITQGILGPGARDMLAFGKLIKDGAVDIAATSGRGGISDETRNTFMTAVLPSAGRRLLRGMEIARTGEVRSAFTGKLLYQPEKRLREATLTAIGAPTSEYTEQVVANEIVERSRLGFSRAHTAFGKEIGLAIVHGDHQGYIQAISDANAAGHVFTADDVHGWVKEMRMTSAERRKRRTPTALRADLSDLFSLTGSPLPQQ